MNEQQMQALIEQKLKEFNEDSITANDEELKKCKNSISEIKKQFEEIAKNQKLSKFDRESAIKDAVFALANINQQLEEHQYLVKRYGQYYKKERENSKMQIQQLININSMIESNCREVQTKNKEISQGNITMKEANEKDRNNIIENCEKSVQEFEDKIVEEETESKKLETENLELREQLKQMIQSHEEFSKKADEDRIQKEEENNQSQAKLQEDYTQIEEQAKEAIEIQKQSSDSFKACQEMKVQIVYYRDKIKEFEQSLEKSKDFLDVVKNEIGKLGLKLKPFCEKKQKLDEKASFGDTIIFQYLNIVQFYSVLLLIFQNKELSESITQLNQEKSKIQLVCKKYQDEYQQKSKQ